jgi:hypothetical protein
MDKEQQSKKDSLISGNDYWTRAYSGRAEVRKQNQFLKAILLILIVGLGWTNYLWASHAASLSKKQYVVFHDQGLQTSANNISEYQTGPSTTEIKATAWQFIRQVMAVSKDTVDKAHEEARRLMSGEFRNEFDATFGEQYRANLKATGVYQQLEEIKLRQLTPEDTPGQEVSIYDIYVSGLLKSYSSASNQLISTQQINFLVNLTPLEERTLEHPTGLVVSGLREFKPAKSVENITKE